MKNQYTITKEEIVSWQKKIPLMGANIVLFILWGVIGLMGLYLLIILAQFGGTWLVWLFAVYCIFVSVYKVFFWRFAVAVKRYKVLANTYGVPEWTRTIEFAEEEIILTDHTSTSRFQYKNIKKITEKDNFIILFMNDQLVLPLYKDTFVEGNWETCKEKIASQQL